MRKFTALRFILFPLVFYVFIFIIPLRISADTCAGQNPCWIIKASLPKPLAGFGITTDSLGKIYLINGNTGNGNSQILYIYDPTSDNWETKSPLPYQGNGLGLTYYPPNNKFYAGGGWHNTPLNNFYEYDPIADEWVAKAPMTYAREWVSLITAPNDKIYAISGDGIDGKNVVPIEEYDPVSNAWTVKSSIPIPVTAAQAILAPNEKIYLIGGHLQNGNQVGVVQEYNPLTDTWLFKKPMTIPRSDFAISLNSHGKIDVIGGATTNVNILPFVDTQSVEEYDPVTDSWTTKTSFPVALHDLGAALGSDENVHVMGGWTPNGIVHNTNYAGAITDTNADLPVPILKQTSGPWQSQTYDTANLWSPANPTINAWGCALTSTAMVLSYHKINKLPDGTELNPGTLNGWLNSQPDGYVGNGLINWLAVSRLSKLAKDSGNNPLFSFDALEYQRISGSDSTTLSSDIQNLIPDILEEPGHFIVAKGIGNTTFNINDPFYDRSDLTSYGNTFLSLGRYIPTSTNLSYIMLVADTDIQIGLKDSNNNALGEQFIQNPLVNDLQINKSSGHPLNIFYLRKPQNGIYQATLVSNNTKIYGLKIYLYDRDGNVNPLTQQGVIQEGAPETFNINFNNQDTNNSSILRIVTFQSTIDDINEAKKLNLINRGVAVSFNSLINGAQRDYENGRKKIALLKISIFEKLLNVIPKKLIDANTYKILTYDAYYLLGHI